MQGIIFSVTRDAEPSNKKIRHIHVGYSIKSLINLASKVESHNLQHCPQSHFINDVTAKTYFQSIYRVLPMVVI